MQILITGGAGFIGSNTAQYLLKSGHSVILFDNLSRYGSKINLERLQKQYGDKLLFIQGDTTGDLSELRSKSKDCEAVFHFAAQVAVTTSVSDPLFDFKVNALGTLNVLDMARSFTKNPIFVFSSTNKVFGDLSHVGVNEGKSRYTYKDLKNGISESTQLDFHSPYGCSKGSADQYVRDFSRIYGMRTVVLRLSCIYGPNQFGIEDQGWVSHLIINTLTGNPIKIYGNGKQARDLLYIDDLTGLFGTILQNPDKVKGEIFNIGGGSENIVSLLELISILEEFSSKKLKPSFHDWRPGDQKLFYCDITKAKQRLGWAPGTDSSTGIKSLFDWTKNNIFFFKNK